MTEIGSSTPGPQTPAPAVPAQRPHRIEGFLHSLTHSLTDSLDLAARGYLCMQLVDCDSTTDPECGPSGKKLVFREAASGQASSAASPVSPPHGGVKDVALQDAARHGGS